MTDLQAEPKKDWSIGEWIANFLQDDGPYGFDPLYEDLYDDGALPPPVGSEDDDAGLVDALVILVLVAALVVMIWYRNYRQAQARRAQEERLRQGLAPLPAEAPGVGLLPGAGPDFAAFAAGGLGL